MTSSEYELDATRVAATASWLYYQHRRRTAISLAMSFLTSGLRKQNHGVNVRVILRGSYATGQYETDIEYDQPFARRPQ